MNTLKDILELHRSVEQINAMEGCTGDFDKQYTERMNAIRTAVREEFGIKTAEQAESMPLDTELPKSAKKLALELRQWLESKKDAFKTT